jgi:hypothetical protein
VRALKNSPALTKKMVLKPYVKISIIERKTHVQTSEVLGNQSEDIDDDQGQ